MATNTKSKPIDLGALQDAYIAAGQEHIAATKALQKAQETATRTKKQLTATREALEAATSAVLS